MTDQPRLGRCARAMLGRKLVVHVLGGFDQEHVKEAGKGKRKAQHKPEGFGVLFLWAPA